MADLIQIAQDTKAAWAALVPEQGEMVYLTDTAELIVGDGATAVASIPPVGSPTYEAAAPSAAATPDMTMAANRRSYFGKIAPTAGAGTYTWARVLPVTNRRSGDRATILVLMPASVNPTITLRNATSGGTLLATVSPDAATARSYRLEAVFTGSAWELWDFRQLV